MRRFQRVRLGARDTATERAWLHAMASWTLELAALALAEDPTSPKARARLKEYAFLYVEASDANARMAAKVGAKGDALLPSRPRATGEDEWEERFPSHLVAEPARMLVTRTPARDVFVLSLHLMPGRPDLKWSLRFERRSGWTITPSVEPRRELEHALALRLKRWPNPAQLPAFDPEGDA